jgi:class 3 adenylate cyclase/Tfp pilus assembly protein PilF
MPAPSPSRRLTTICFADIAGFTRLSATDEALSLRVMNIMRECMKAAAGAHRGTIIKFLGDGALAEFPSAEGGVMAALEAAARFKGGTRPLPEGPFQLHTGIHVGDVTPSDDGKDIFGDGVNRAQRVESLGKPGQTLISEEVYRLVRRRPELAFASLGQQTAKGLDESFEVFLVTATGDLAKQLEELEQGPALPVPTGRPVRVVPYSRAVGIGITAAVAAFGGLAIWSALGGEPEVAAAVSIPDTIRLPARDPAFAMPVWPARSPREVLRTASNTGSLQEVAAAGERYFTDLGRRNLATHEVLPALRRSLYEAREGTPQGPRADAIRGVALFIVARDPIAAERAFKSSIEAAPSVGMTRVLYAQLLTAQGRFDEAKKQLDEAKNNGVTDATLDAARGGMLFRRGEFGDAKGTLEHSLKTEDVLATRVLMARAQIQQNKIDDALRTLDQRIGSPEVVPWMAYARLRAEHRKNRNAAAPAQMLELARRPSSGYAGAAILLEAGQPDQALDVLTRLAARQDPDLIWLGVDPEWTPLYNNTRFRALVSRVLGNR